ncbi:DUF4160 domain-containing protein [Anaerovibrio sp.]|uniref:DUF4160 domain-containing protein n=1 Tax=Anaerovibrio sp. TaxID=1872532 RepID=UPI00388F5CD8
MVTSLPTLFEIFGYRIFFWSNEAGEPIHVHVCRGKPTGNTTKIWLPPDSNPVVANNNSNIPEKDLKRIMKMIALNRDTIIAQWYDYFNK